MPYPTDEELIQYIRRTRPSLYGLLIRKYNNEHRIEDGVKGVKGPQGYPQNYVMGLDFGADQDGAIVTAYHRGVAVTDDEDEAKNIQGFIKGKVNM